MCAFYSFCLAYQLSSISTHVIVNRLATLYNNEIMFWAKSHMVYSPVEGKCGRKPFSWGKNVLRKVGSSTSLLGLKHAWAAFRFHLHRSEGRRVKKNLSKLTASDSSLSIKEIGLPDHTGREMTWHFSGVPHELFPVFTAEKLFSYQAFIVVPCFSIWLFDPVEQQRITRSTLSQSNVPQTCWTTSPIWWGYQDGEG